MNKSAFLSKDNQYRYMLKREWRNDGTLFAFFGVNPSTANAHIDDATVRKWIGFTKRNEGRGFLVGNVFAYRSTNVKALADVDDPVGGEEAYNWLDVIIERADVLVPCWGNIEKVPNRLQIHFPNLMRRMLISKKPIKTFGYTKGGHPKHPLFLPYSTELVTYPEQFEHTAD